MKKSEILRGRVLFKRVALKGRRLDARLLRCSYLVLNEKGAPLQVAFKVPSRNINAVRRNRLRRLMREAVSSERILLERVLTQSDTHVGMILVYKGAKDVPVTRVSLAQIRSDIEMFCRSIAETLS